MKICDKTQKDALMMEMFATLVSDLRSSANIPFVGKCLSQAIASRDVPAMRAAKLPDWLDAPRNTAKAVYQMENFAKRYVFDNDKLSEEDLKAKAILDFKKHQATVSTRLPESASTHMVLREARRICSQILGPFPKDEHFNLSHFGRKAATGLAACDAYLDTRFETLTGTPEQLRWFSEFAESQNKVFPRNLKEIPCNKLTLTAVPKSHRAARTITPFTVVGGLMSAGIGKMLYERLKSVGIDMAYQQDLHRLLCKNASVDKRLTTLDLSKASDNIGFVHLRRLLPVSWFREINRCRVPTVQIGDENLRTSTFMMMGVGYTSTLQTLVFYSLIKAICNLTNTSGRVSVFGDDCIYPTRVHRYVLGVFSSIGFEVNSEKTFSDESFRESCGADFYRGLNIRPYMPKTSDDESFEQFSYKLYNGIFSRWPIHQLPGVRHLLISTISAIRGIVFQVPFSAPETSGIRVAAPNVVDDWYINWSPVRLRPSKAYKASLKVVPEQNPSTAISNLAYTFMSVVEPTPLKREVSRQFPYLWEALRKNSLRKSIPLSLGWVANTSGHGVGLEHVLVRKRMRPNLYTTQEQIITWFSPKFNEQAICKKIRLLCKAEKIAGSGVSAERQNLLLALRQGHPLVATVPSRGRSSSKAGPARGETSFWFELDCNP